MILAWAICQQDIQKSLSCEQLKIMEELDQQFHVPLAHCAMYISLPTNPIRATLNWPEMLMESLTELHFSKHLNPEICLLSSPNCWCNMSLDDEFVVGVWR